MFGNRIEKKLKAVGAAEGFRVKKFSQLHGGSINRVLKLETQTGKKVIKLNEPDRFPGLFEAEKDGLEALERQKCFDVPAVYSLGEIETSAYLLMEYIPKKNKPTTDFWIKFAEKLAKLHRKTNPNFGFPTSNYIGSLPQSNKKTSTAAEFYISQRLEPQFKLARENGFDFKNLEVIFRNISAEIPPEPPSLIHGDLWNGNYLVTKNGQPCLIDPAVCFGPREMDLAMMRLFGGFPKKVFSVYDEIFPLADGFEKRLPLWQLYYLLVHLNLFGETYLPQVENSMRPYDAPKKNGVSSMRHIEEQRKTE